MLRRSGRVTLPRQSVIAVNGVRLDAATRSAWCDGESLTLTSTEFDILERLMRAAGRIVSRRDLTKVACQRDLSPFDRSLDVHISHLRTKLERRRSLIKTVRGVGYLFRAEPEQAIDAAVTTHLAQALTRGTQRIRTAKLMRSIVVRVLLGFFAIGLVSILAVRAATSYVISRDAGPGGAGGRLGRLQSDEAQYAFETGGREGLARYFARLSRYFPDQRRLLDASTATSRPARISRRSSPARRTARRRPASSRFRGRSCSSPSRPTSAIVCW